MMSKFHAFMFPWFGFGHMTAFLHLANKLAEKGHKITFLLPKKALKQLEPLNLFPDYIFFHTLTIPSVDGLPAGAETTSDIQISSGSFLASAMDRTRNQVQEAVSIGKPDLIFFDFAHWIPEIAGEYGARSVNFITISAACVAISFVPGRSPDDLAVPPPGYPSSKVLLRGQETNCFSFLSHPFGDNTTFYERIMIGLTNCDVISIRTCQEMEGKFCDFIESQFQREVLLTGPMLPEPDNSKPLEDQWMQWLSRFEPGSVVYCALGSQIILEKDQFQELCLGMELTGLPFLVAVKPPKGSSTIQEALPNGFEERVKGRGVVWGRWVQQPLILAHPSIGCFVSHCGFGSMWEGLVNDCQIVFIPHLGEQIFNTRLMSEELEVSVEVEREDTGWFSKESLSGSIRSVMDKDSELGNLVRRNHAKWKDSLVSTGLMNGYVNKFIEALQKLV
ncbi:PREDICTED: UDP-glycosyltransferase 79B6-like [Camelina sativa]|uniref:Glycosyltransferase n=1 Tax=Camelina sativa TaxID=90675 RepID=A0ABM0UTY9_CAMSA|nr:PREDICTED: UDP-glycosyltransferase 79B6-like [Camelina sativa]